MYSRDPSSISSSNYADEQFPSSSRPSNGTSSPVPPDQGARNRSSSANGRLIYLASTPAAFASEEPHDSSMMTNEAMRSIVQRLQNDEKYDRNGNINGTNGPTNYSYRQSSAIGARSPFTSSALLQQLKERSPGNSSALLELISKYPEARQNVEVRSMQTTISTNQPDSMSHFWKGRGGESEWLSPSSSIDQSSYRLSSLPSDSYSPSVSSSSASGNSATHQQFYNDHSAAQVLQSQASSQSQPSQSQASASSGGLAEAYLLARRELEAAKQRVLQSERHRHSRSPSPFPFEQPTFQNQNSTSHLSLDPYSSGIQGQAHQLINSSNTYSRVSPTKALTLPSNYYRSPAIDFSEHPLDRLARLDTQLEHLLADDPASVHRILAAEFANNQDNDDMSKSTNEWSKSFAQMQGRFRDAGPIQDQGQGNHVNGGGFYTAPSFVSGMTADYATMPRGAFRPGMASALSKSTSQTEMPSLLQAAVEKRARASEAPEPRHSPNGMGGPRRGSGAIDSFWSNTVGQRASSPTIQRIPSHLTAAERLQLLQEPVDGKPGTPPRMGSGTALAARRAQYLNEAAPPPNAQEKPAGRPAPAYSGSNGPNFTGLDRAVQELEREVRTATGYSQGARRIGGCMRFPTEENTLSPHSHARNMTFTSGGSYSAHTTHSLRPRRDDHSLSPESTSDASSIYQIPTGLPHPKPKHNVKEQLHQVYSQNGYLSPKAAAAASFTSRSPNFPVPTIGSVASRITEFERRPGTPTIQVASGFDAATDTRPVAPPLSPRGTVFRSRPIIHVDLGSKSPQFSNTHFDFPAKNVTVANYSAASAQDIAPVHKPHPEPSSYQLAVNTSQPQQQPWVNGRTPPGGKATPTTANHSVAASKAQTTDFDSSSGTSDGSINISKATKGIEETLRLDGKVLNNLLDEQYRPSPKKASSPTKKPPRQPLINYPRFYYPQGQPVSSVVNDSALRRVCEVFKAFPNQQCEIDDMFEVCQAAGLPLYWKAPIFAALTKNEPRPATLMDFTVWWRAMTSVAHDEASRFVYTLTGGTRSHLLPVDFHSLVMNIIHTHPGLGFYREAVEFHDKYRDVVVTRIFWNVARNWSGKITTEEIRKSDLLQAIRELQLDDDINKSLRYFSYEHFYVVYCKFFDLDTDHDMKIDRDDLATHSDGAIVPLVIERIFSGAVCRIARRKSNVEQIGLVEFTQFLLAEEDKAHRTSIEYWFRILDQDGDGIVTLYDMEKFHEQIQKKLAERNIDSMAFKDVACQLIDMIGSGCTSSFRLKDLKASKLRARFINSFVNWHKFYTQETNEGSESARIEDESGQELSEWDRYCMEEYEQILEHDEAETISVNLDDEDRPTMTFHDLL